MKYAIVTGGTSGIGLGVAKMLLEKGYYVFATYVGPDFTEEIANYEAIKINQTKRSEVYNFIDYVYNNIRKDSRVIFIIRHAER